MGLKKKGMAPLLVAALIVAVVSAAAVVFFLFPGFSYLRGVAMLPMMGEKQKRIVSAHCADALGNEISCTAPPFFSVIGSPQAVSYIWFDISVSNTGPFDLQNVRIVPASDSGLNKSGSMYEALKNGNPLPKTIESLGIGSAGLWSTRESCSLGCDANEECVSDDCLLPTGQFTADCAGGCDFAVAAEATYVYMEEERAVTKSGAAQCTIYNAYAEDIIGCDSGAWSINSANNCDFETGTVHYSDPRFTCPPEYEVCELRRVDSGAVVDTCVPNDICRKSGSWEDYQGVGKRTITACYCG